MPLSRLLAVSFVVALLSGCAGTPSPSHRYALPDGGIASPASPATEPSHTLVVRPVRLASYLSGDGIVLQLDDITLNQARDHLWAEDLGRQLERGLRQRLSERLPDTRVLTDANDSDALVMRVEVERFQGHHDGMAIASGQWQLRDQRGNVLALEPFTVTTELDADGYPALVRALGRSWDRVAERIATRVQALR